MLSRPVVPRIPPRRCRTGVYDECVNSPRLSAPFTVGTSGHVSDRLRRREWMGRQMGTLVLTHMDRWDAFGFGRSEASDAVGRRGVSAAVAGASVGRPLPAGTGAPVPVAVPIGRRGDVTA